MGFGAEKMQLFWIIFTFGVFFAQQNFNLRVWIMARWTVLTEDDVWKCLW